MVDTLTRYWAQFLTMVGLVLSGQMPVAIRRHTRGAGFLEYALLGLVAVFIFIIFRGQIAAFLADVWGRIDLGSKA